MNILICNESINHGGIGTYTLSLIKELKARGWGVYFLVTHGPGEYFNEAVKLADRVLDFSGLKLSLQKLMIVAQAINDIAPDILLLNHCSLVHYTLPILSSNIKAVAVLHNDVELFYRVATLFCSHISYWIAPSEKLKITFQSRLSLKYKRRVLTIWHGIDNIKFSPGERVKSSNILFIGNLGENKGADLLPHIFSHVMKILPNWRFTVAGDGDLKQSLASTFALMGIPIQFTGYVSAEAIVNLFRESDILLLPTRVEGFGLVIVEAMACGTVPVVTRLEGITDRIVADGVNGILVPNVDVVGFANAIIRLGTNSALLDSLSKNAIFSTASSFSLQRMCDEYEAIFLDQSDEPIICKAGWLRWTIKIVGQLIKNKFDRFLFRARGSHIFLNPINRL